MRKRVLPLITIMQRHGSAAAGRFCSGLDEPNHSSSATIRKIAKKSLEKSQSFFAFFIIKSEDLQASAPHHPFYYSILFDKDGFIRSHTKWTQKMINF